MDTVINTLINAIGLLLNRPVKSCCGEIPFQGSLTFQEALTQEEV